MSQYELLERGTLPHFQSAQLAELHALTRACQLSKGKSVNIYTDSKYALGWSMTLICYRNKGFLTSTATHKSKMGLK